MRANAITLRSSRTAIAAPAQTWFAARPLRDVAQTLAAHRVCCGRWRCRTLTRCQACVPPM